MLPVRCFTCGYPIGYNEKRWERALQKYGELEMHKALEEVNAVRDCCRRMYMSFVNWVDAKMDWQDANAIRSLYDTTHTKVARICANPYMRYDGGDDPELWAEISAMATSKTRPDSTPTTTARLPNETNKSQDKSRDGARGRENNGKEKSKSRNDPTKGAGSEHREPSRDSKSDGDTPYFMTHGSQSQTTSKNRAASMAESRFDPFDDYDENEHDYYEGYYNDDDDDDDDDGYDNYPSATLTDTAKDATGYRGPFAFQQQGYVSRANHKRKAVDTNIDDEEWVSWNALETSFDGALDPSARVVRVPPGSLDSFSTTTNTNDVGA